MINCSKAICIFLDDDSASCGYKTMLVVVPQQFQSMSAENIVSCIKAGLEHPETFIGWRLVRTPLEKYTVSYNCVRVFEETDIHD